MKKNKKKKPDFSKPKPEKKDELEKMKKILP